MTTAASISMIADCGVSKVDSGVGGFNCSVCCGDGEICIDDCGVDLYVVKVCIEIYFLYTEPSLLINVRITTELSRPE